jgi:hypothetical protein
MKYSIENNGQELVKITVYAPKHLALPFLSFIEQKSRENVPIIKTSLPSRDEEYFKDLNALACSLFDAAVNAGSSLKSALSQTNYKLKAHGYANTSYEITKQILQRNGKFKQKSK